MYFSLFNFCFYQIISILSLSQAWLYLANHLGSWEGGLPGIYNTSPKTKPGKKKILFFYLMIISSNTQTKKNLYP